MTAAPSAGLSPPVPWLVAGQRDAPAADQRREDADIVALGARRPRVQRQRAQAGQLVRVADLDGLTADQHAPAGAGRLVGPVDLEGDPGAAEGGVQLAAPVGA